MAKYQYILMYQAIIWAIGCIAICTFVIYQSIDYLHEEGRRNPLGMLDACAYYEAVHGRPAGKKKDEKTPGPGERRSTEFTKTSPSLSLLREFRHRWSARQSCPPPYPRDAEKAPSPEILSDIDPHVWSSGL